MVMHRILSRLKRDRRGMAAVEFALILPFMAALLIGSYELRTGMETSRRVSHVSSSLADLFGQARSISNTDRDNIFNAARSIMFPYDNTTLKIVVTQVKIDSAGKATVDWSDAYGTTALTKGATVTIPADLKQANTYLLMGQITYPHKVTFGSMITDLTGTINFTDQFYIRPRRGASVTRT